MQIFLMKRTPFLMILLHKYKEQKFMKKNFFFLFSLMKFSIDQFLFIYVFSSRIFLVVPFLI